MSIDVSKLSYQCNRNAMAFKIRATELRTNQVLITKNLDHDHETYTLSEKKSAYVIEPIQKFDSQQLLLF